MRFIYKLLLGLVLFNSFLALFAGFFSIGGTNPVESESAINVTSDIDYTSYEITGDFFSWDTATIAVMGTSIALGLFASWVMKSPVPIGAALFSGIVSSLYLQSASVISNITPSDNWIITSIIGLVGICIGILLRE